VKILTAVLLVLFCVGADARTKYAGEWDKVDPATRSWFKGVRSPHNVPCCDIADGHSTLEDWRGQNEYWIPNPAALGPIEWMRVPPEAVIYNSGNPTGEAVVWYTMQSTGEVFIRCFVPGGGV
jgi:hypothetical protein